MLRRDFIKAIGVTAAAALYGGCRMPFSDTGTCEKKPNIILVVSDDQGYGDFECFSNPMVKTPNLNSLYAQSTSFHNFYVCPVCAPTRASLMTGRYNYRTGVWDTWKSRMNMFADETTIAEALKANGYNTGIFGKWHLGYNYPMRPMDQGFDYALTFYGTDSRFDPLMDVNGEKRRYEGYLTDVLFDEAIKFMNNTASPFFVYLPTFVPHDFPSKQVPDDELEFYRDADGICEADKHTYAMVNRFDKNLGRLLKSVENSKLKDNTIIIFLSDNGPDLEHPAVKLKKDCPPRYNMALRDGKGSVYEGGIRVPCFVRWPRVTKPGKRIDRIAAHIDIMPTILEMCGVSSAGMPFDGVSLVPLLNGGQYSHDGRSLFGQFQRAAVPDMWTNCYVRSQDFKLVNGCELYNITDDPEEKFDLSSEYPQKVAQMRKEYQRWFEDVSAERNFTGERVILGSEKQPLVRLKYWNQTEDGWLVEVANSGLYNIKVAGIQSDLLKEGAAIEMSICGKRVGAYDIEAGQSELKIAGVYLDACKGNLKVVINGLKTKILPYGDTDVGYRFVFIEKVE